MSRLYLVTHLPIVAALTLCLIAPAGHAATITIPAEHATHSRIRPVNASERQATTRRVALFIGISDYRHFSTSGAPGETDLKGPAGDVARMRASLRRWGFGNEEDTRVLLNERASREGILEGLRWIASRTRDTTDVAVIFYSGHGSWAADEDGDESRVFSGDDRDEALVPWDASNIHDARQLVTDDQIRSFLSALPTRNVTMIVDACFSGTMTRGAAEQSVARPKGAAADRVAATVASQNLDWIYAPGHTLITAANANEVAEERLFPTARGERFFGVLTYYLTQALDYASPATRYDEVMRRVVMDMKQSLARQSPQVEGDVGARLFQVDGDVARRAYASVIRHGSEHVSLDVGALHGVRNGALYEIHATLDRDFEGAPLARVEVDSVTETSSYARMLGETIAIPKGARAVLARVPFGASRIERLPVHLTASAQALRPRLDSLEFVRVVQEPGTAVHITADDNGVSITSGEQPLPPLGEYPRNWVAASRDDGGPIGYAATAAALCAPLARALFIANLEQISNPARPENLRAEIRVVDSDSLLELPAGQVDTLRPGKRYTVYARIRAPLQSVLYVTAAVAGYSGAPSVLYPRANLAGKAMNQPFTLGTWQALSRDISIEEPFGTELIKLVAGPSQYDFFSLAAALPVCGGERGSRQRAETTSESVAGWVSAERRLLLVPIEGAR